MDPETIIYAGIAIFAASSAYFYFMQQKQFNAAFLVSFITLASYTIMLEGSFVSLNSEGEELYWTRWVGYALSCTLLIYTIGTMLKKKTPEIAQMVYLTAIVMLTGAFASIFEDEFMWALFAISTVAYILLVWPIVIIKKANEYINYFIVLGWSVFPVVFILSHEGLGVIENTEAFAIYLALDLFTKIGFYVFMPKEK